MNKAVDPVLELLSEVGIPLPVPTLKLILRRRMADPPSEMTIYRALDPLVENGHLEKVGDGTTHYEITEKGRQYLAGEIESEELED